jgi:5-oxoprolinase (ATP-hydrolysing) subunit A
MPDGMDLNADLGESFGAWRLGDDEALVAHITSANVACGFHAGDFRVMEATVALCRRAGVAIGAQPGYPDLLGFGRRPMAFDAADVESLVRYQIGALDAFCRAQGVEMQHVKPHGALYNQAATDRGLAGAIARAVARFSRDLALFGLASSEPMANAAADAGLRFVPEAFADRRYRPDGTLQPRDEPGSVITHAADAAAQAVAIGEGRGVTAVDGSSVALRAESICCHGDTSGAVAIAAAVRSGLESAGLRVAAVRDR